MTLEEALAKADEAEKQMYCGTWPVACKILAAEIRRLKKRKKRIVPKLSEQQEKVYSDITTSEKFTEDAVCDVFCKGENE